jgi:para-aminobenzoate synthetase/4-amino-4-deoxychorismate lyase
VADDLGCEARTRAGCSLADVFAALFPCGSITGAPKVRAMQAIHALEAAPRGVYCGAIGVLRPGGAATFNVPIRTVTLRGSQARCGIGSGITSGATAEGEWREWGLKQAFVRRASAPFELLETLGLSGGQLRDVDAHLTRMGEAARHFGYPWDARQAEAALRSLAQQHAEGAWRVRLLLAAQGKLQAEAYALPASPARVRLQLAGRALDETHGEFVRFKTTRRAHYDAFTPTEPECVRHLAVERRGRTHRMHARQRGLLAGRPLGHTAAALRAAGRRRARPCLAVRAASMKRWFVCRICRAWRRWRL